MEKRINSSANKKGDYWYIDHRGKAARLLLVGMAAVLAIMAASCSSSMDSAFTAQPDATRGTSDLLGSVVSVVNTTTGTVTSVVSSLKWFIDCSVVAIGTCPFVTSIDGSTLGISSSKSFDKVEVYYTDRSKDGYSMNTTSVKLKLRAGKTVDGFMVRLKSDGSKWFFDNGKWFIDADSARWYGDVDSATAPSTTTTTSTAL